MHQQPLSVRLEEALAITELELPIHRPVARQGLTVFSGNPSVEAVKEIVSYDPVLASTLFRHANSAFYRGLAPVAGFDEALTRLGLDVVGAELRQNCLDAVNAPSGRLFPDYLPKLWQHSFGCALGARWLAERCGYRLLAEQAYQAGLLHDIGKFALLAALERLAADESIAPLLAPQLVETILVSQHVEAGLHLHAGWGLHDVYAPVIGRHHDRGGDGHALLVVLVRLANQGCRKLGLGCERDSELVLPTTAEAQFLGLDEIAMAEFEIMLEDHSLLGYDQG